MAPYHQAEVTGQRMLAGAAEAGLRDNTKIHGVFDRGTWIHPHFEAQFGPDENSAVTAAFLLS